MHPDHNQGRRKARAAALLKTAAAMPDSVAFVDAAKYPDYKHYVAAVTSLQGELLTALTIRNSDPDRAEQVAIALAMANTTRTTIYTDSRTAAQAFRVGSVCKEAASVLSRASWTDTKHLIWFPGHMGSDAHPLVPNANELAHFQARDLTRRVRREGGPRPKGEKWLRNQLQTYNEICQHYRLERRKFPLPHPRLKRPQALSFRLLQTGAYPSPAVYARFMSELRPGCPRCGIPRCNLQHMLWQCPELRADDGSPTTEKDWDTLLTSPHDLALEFQLPVPLWARPADDAP
uniref:Tick transposon n=1 Tax=Rhipicephalus pulchellus TaxID=72859 RepID=L7LWP2_RHIPC